MEALRRLIRLATGHKISQDLLWTFGSFSVLAISGIAINLIIAWTRDASALGVFNLAYAIYLIASQIATLGIHYSVLRHAAYHQEEPEKNGSLIFTAILLSTGLGLIMGSALYIGAPMTEALFGSNDVAEALHYAAFGLCLFPLNKCLIIYTNSLRHMRAFSVLQSIRYLTVVGVVAYISMSDIPFTRITLSFFAAELLTCICCTAYLLSAGLLKHLRFSMQWVRTHIVFGTKGVFAGIFLDLNTRLDVLVLGVLLSDHAVGIYSFAAMLVDGIQHILAIIRVNFNPILVKALRDKDHALATRMLRLSKHYVTIAIAVLGACLVAGFFVAVEYLIPGKDLEQGLMSLVILITGFVLISGFAPFDNLFLVSGHPGYQTAQCATVTVLNVALCLFLTPKLGIEGAALATAAGYIGGTLLLIYLSPRLTKWHLVANRFD